LINKNGDSCDLYFNIFKDPEVNLNKLEINGSSPCIGADEEGGNIGPSFPISSAIGGSGGKKEPISQFDRNFRSSSNDAAIAFKTQCNEMTTVQIFDCRGTCLKTLFRGILEKGSHSISWDRTNRFGGKVAAGLYFIALNRGNGLSIIKSVVAR
jgi:hypothetical protein